jgi:hypothetical protein
VAGQAKWWGRPSVGRQSGAQCLLHGGAQCLLLLRMLAPCDATGHAQLHQTVKEKRGGKAK